ncbi:MAG TPA: peptidoglycan DD-metalloendopeptidase family protein [Dehalococcoidia bacterium]
MRAGSPRAAQPARPGMETPGPGDDVVVLQDGERTVRFSLAPYLRRAGRVINPALAGTVLGLGALTGGGTAHAAPVRVQPGDTLSHIALRHYGSLDFLDLIIRANGISNPDLIYAGDVLELPDTSQPGAGAPAGDGDLLTVAPGDALWLISLRAYGSSQYVAALARYNGISNPDLIYAGQQLRVPPLERLLGGSSGAPAPAPPPAPAPSVPSVLSRYLAIVEVQPGDALSTISQRYYGAAGYEAHIAGANGIANPNVVYAGTFLRLPYLGAAPGGVSFIRPAAGVTVDDGEFGAPRPGRFYPYHTGLDFANDAGTPVHAAASGVVTHAGWEGTYGITVVINHGNGYTTRYAHLSAAHVAPGQTVAVGQLIGSMGSTGFSEGPHLHFEIIRGGAFLNPVFFLP